MSDSVTGSGGGVQIGAHCKISNGKQIIFKGTGDIGAYSFISPVQNGKIIVGDNVRLGMNSRIQAMNRVCIGKNFLTGPNIFISDFNHVYVDVERPICDQIDYCKTNSVVIDDDCWIGTNAVIVGNVHIGKHVVVGAGSVVTKDVPAFSVIVGNPARIVKQYDFESKEWKHI